MTEEQKAAYIIAMAEQKTAYIIAKAAVLNATIAGMVAANSQTPGNTPYTEEDFEDAINASGCHHNAVIECFQG